MSLRQNLRYFWRIHLAVLLGSALAATVLTGALLVGDSVRGSLRNLTLTRLGKIDDALISSRFFREELAAELVAADGGKQIAACAPAIVLTGAAVNSSTRARATGVNILGIDERFTRFFRGHSPPIADSLPVYLKNPPRQIFPSVVINQSLQKELGVAVGDAVLLYLERHSDIHRELLFADREADALVRSLRLTVRAIVPDENIGRFGLQPAQSLPRNAFVSLPVLQKALDVASLSGKQSRDAGTNALFVRRAHPVEDQSAPAPLNATSLLRPVWQLSDLGLHLRHTDHGVVLESREFVLEDALADAAQQVARSLQIAAMPVLTYLANEVEHHGQRMPYATIAALDLARAERFGGLILTNGQPAPPPKENEILLNQWAAQDLQAQPGDTLTVRYYQVESAAGNLRTDTVQLVVSGTVRMEGLGAQPLLTPEFPGIHDAQDVRDWDPPFPVQLDWIRPKDEAYWDEYRAAPRGFISLSRGQQLWQSRFGKLTSLWLATPADTTDAMASFRNKLLATVAPGAVGLTFDPVKARGLQAAAGATDFSGLFIGFSLFLIVAAVLLVGLLFRLGVEQRVREVGILLATGYPLRRIRRRFLGEGLIVSAAGTLLGIPGALGYAALMMTGLRTWWRAATGTGFLFLHVSTASLLLGLIFSLGAVVISIWLTLRKLQKIPAVALVAGVADLDFIPDNAAKPPRKWRQWLPWGTLGGAALLSVGGAMLPESSRAPLFFVSGALLLICGLQFTARWLRGYTGTATGHPGGLWSMAARNNARKPARSMLGIALVAGACFVILSVGAFRTDFRKMEIRKNSGVGGYSLMAQSDIPLFHDLNSEEGRFALGMSAAADTLLEGTTIMPFRLRPGEDASCLNLYRPQQPRVLGVPPAQVRRGGFRFQTSTTPRANPWELLETEIAPDVIPAIGDANSVQWILHAALGDDIAMPADDGRIVRLRLVALLSKSIFQSELLISEENFRKYFPDRSGYRYFLIDAPEQKAAAIATVLENDLGDYGLDATSTTEKLAGYQAVENTYLSVFQTLGGLGLLLGTLGLGIVLFRNVLERRGELATLRAFGFRREFLRRLLVAENALLILWGMLIGAVAAAIAVLPQLWNRMAEIPWIALGATLLIVLLAGLAASVGAAAAALRIPLLPALKAE